MSCLIYPPYWPNATTTVRMPCASTTTSRRLTRCARTMRPGWMLYCEVPASVVRVPANRECDCEHHNRGVARAAGQFPGRDPGGGARDGRLPSPLVCVRRL